MMHKSIIRALSVGTVLLGTLGASALPGRAFTEAAAIPRCHTGRLYIAQVPHAGQGAAGHVEVMFSVTSLAQQACYLEGYPGIQLIDASGRDIATHLQWGGVFSNRPKQYVVLKTGQIAYFDLGWLHIPTPGQSCPTASYLLVTPSDERTPIAVAGNLQRVCGGKLSSSPIIASSAP